MINHGPCGAVFIQLVLFTVLVTKCVIINLIIEGISIADESFKTKTNAYSTSGVNVFCFWYKMYLNEMSIEVAVINFELSEAYRNTIDQISKLMTVSLSQILFTMAVSGKATMSVDQKLHLPIDNEQTESYIHKNIPIQMNRTKDLLLTETHLRPSRQHAKPISHSS